MYLALNNLQRLICHKTKPSQTKHVIQYSICWFGQLLQNDLNLRYSFYSFDFKIIVQKEI